MQVIPAIDLRGGRCVRLLQGRFDQETIFSDDPVSMAKQWDDQGAERLHVVDLDGARTGAPAHLEVIREIVRALRIPVQVGGGIRTSETIEQLLTAGVERVILGSAAIAAPEWVGQAVGDFGHQRIVVGIDAKDGSVAVHGWTETSSVRALDLARQMKGLGVARIVYTDIARDGTLEGPNIPALESVAQSGLEVIASGGVATLGDLAALRTLEPIGVRSVIVGKALYAQTVQLAQAIAVAAGAPVETAGGGEV